MLMNPNFNSDRVVIFHFPPYSAGKTVWNSMSFHDDVYLMNLDVAAKQYNNDFTLEDKIDFYNNAFSKQETDSKWNDMGMDNDAFVGFSLTQVLRWSPLEYIMETYDRLPFNKKFIDLTYKDSKWIFINSHTVNSYRVLKKWWPNARTVNCVDSYDVIKWRTKRGIFRLNPDHLKDMIDYTDKTVTHLSNNNVHEFDASSMLDVGVYLQEMEKIYNYFGLDGYDKYKTCVTDYILNWTKQNQKLWYGT